MNHTYVHTYYLSHLERDALLCTYVCIWLKHDWYVFTCYKDNNYLVVSITVYILQYKQKFGLLNVHIIPVAEHTLNFYRTVTWAWCVHSCTS